MADDNGCAERAKDVLIGASAVPSYKHLIARCHRSPRSGPSHRPRNIGNAFALPRSTSAVARKDWYGDRAVAISADGS